MRKQGLGGWRIATIRGVDLKLHVSLLILLFYVVIVASAQFPLVARSAGIDVAMISGGPLIWGFIFAIALLISVALHEFGHVLVAQAQGVAVRGITLMMLGGMSEMAKMPDKKYAEFKLAVIGPIVSFAIAGALFAIRAFTSWPEIVLFTTWLGRVNFVLAVFNLLPAFPMDGGRALRSLLAARQGQIRATRNAVRVSHALAWGLGILGFLSFNIILMLIAFFIYMMAKSELMTLMTQDLLQGIRALDVGIRTEVLHEQDSIARAVERMRTSRNVVLPVRTSSGQAAIISLRTMLTIPRARWDTTTVEQVQETVSRELDVNDFVQEAFPDLSSAISGALPMTEMGRIIGVVRVADLSDVIQIQSIARQQSEEPRRAA